MKVKIGNYVSWSTPEQLLIEWLKPIIGEKRYEKLEDFVEPGMDLLRPITSWFYSKRKRKIDVKIDDFDVWGMDHTLSLIILPMLRRLKEVKHGYPSTADEDVPAHLRRDVIGGEDADAEFMAGYCPQRWDWIMDEMIWAFESLAEDSIEKYYSDVEVEGWDKSYGNTWVDNKNMRLDADRTANGFRLFGKYYQGLWD